MSAEVRRYVVTRVIPKQDEGDSSEEFISRVRSKLLEIGENSAVLELTPDHNTDSNRVMVIYPNGGDILSQSPEEPFREFCGRVGGELIRNDAQGTFIIFDRVHENEPVAIALK